MVSHADSVDLLASEIESIAPGKVFVRVHEKVFLLTRSARYWYDADAVRTESDRMSAYPDANNPLNQPDGWRGPNNHGQDPRKWQERYARNDTVSGAEKRPSSGSKTEGKRLHGAATSALESGRSNQSGEGISATSHSGQESHTLDLRTEDEEVGRSGLVAARASDRAGDSVDMGVRGDVPVVKHERPFRTGGRRRSARRGA